MDVWEKSRPHRDSITGPSSPQPVAIPTELPGPHTYVYVARINSWYNLYSDILNMLVRSAHFTCVLPPLPLPQHTPTNDMTYRTAAVKPREPRPFYKCMYFCFIGLFCFCGVSGRKFVLAVWTRVTVNIKVRSWLYKIMHFVLPVNWQSWDTLYIYSFSSLSHDRFKASSKSSSPHNSI
jgi:hypothetical protein